MSICGRCETALATIKVPLSAFNAGLVWDRNERVCLPCFDQLFEQARSTA